MNNISNLVKLQFNSLLAIKKNLLIILALGIFFAAVQPTMIVFASAMYLMMATYTITFYEEISKMNYLIYSLPVKTNEYIFSKYIYCLLNTVIAVIISTILSVIVFSFFYAYICYSFSYYGYRYIFHSNINACYSFTRL